MEVDKFKIWMAGFYEGEGSVSNDKSNNNRLRVSIAQNDSTPLMIAQEIWGGSIRERTRISASGKLCFGHEWRLCHNNSLIFLKDIEPYLIIPYKINQIIICKKKAELGIKRKFKCNFCNKHYASPSGRRRHEKNNHINSNASNQIDCETIKLRETPESS